jgi:hypothetical protein
MSNYPHYGSHMTLPAGRARPAQTHYPGVERLWRAIAAPRAVRTPCLRRESCRDENLDAKRLLVRRRGRQSARTLDLR